MFHLFQKTKTLSQYRPHKFYICILLLLSTLIDSTLEASSTNFTYQNPIAWGAHYVSMSQTNPYFNSDNGTYTFTLSLGRIYKNVKYANIALNGYKSQTHDYFDFDVVCQVNNDPASIVNINLTVANTSQFSYFSFSVMIISETLDMYITVLDVNFTTQLSPQYVPSPINLTNISTNILSFITSVSLKFIWSRCDENDDYDDVSDDCYPGNDCWHNYCPNSQYIRYSWSKYNSSFLKVTNTRRINHNPFFIKMFILLIDTNQFQKNSPFDNIKFDFKIDTGTRNGGNFALDCIKNYSLYSPNYDVKCLIGMRSLFNLFPQPYIQFDLSSTGITHFRTQYYLRDTKIYLTKYYTTTCWRMVVCPDEFPFYNATSNVCNDCSGYIIVNGTLPQYCEQLQPTKIQYYFNYTNSLTYICKSCQICSNLTYLDMGICYKCDLKYQFCLYCNQTVCKGCDDSHYIDETMNYSCIHCGIPIKECVSCTNISFCLQCRAPQYFANQFGKCQCIVGWNVTDTCTTIIGCISSHKINNVTRCLACDSRRYFKYVQNNCQCRYGYSLILNKSSVQNSYCQQTCGDGSLINDECDDGNIFNGDGCSNNCTIEPSYICFEGSLSSKSTCALQISFQLSVYSILRIFGENTGLIKVRVSPNLNNLKFVKWINYVTQKNYSDSIQLSILSIIFDQKLGNLQILVNFNETIEKNKTNFNVCYDTDYFSTKCNQINFTLRGMNAPLNKENFLQHHEILIIFSYVVGIICLLISILSFFKFSYVGMENILTFMTIYYCRLLNQNQNAVLMYVLSPLRYAQGFNDILVDQGRDYNLRPTATRYHMSGETLININISLLFLLVFITIYFVFTIKKLLFISQFESQIKGKIVPNKVYSVLIPVYEKVQNFQHNFLYPIMLLNIYLICSTFGKWLFLTKYYQYEFNGPIWVVVSSLFFIVSLITFYSYMYEVNEIMKMNNQQNQYHQLKCKTLQGRVDEDYSAFLTIFYMFSAFFLISSWGYDTQISTFGYYDLYIYLGVCSLYFLLVLYLRPYSGFIHNVGVLYNQFVIVFFVSFLTYTKYISPELSIFNVICLYILLVFLFGVNLIGIFRIYKQWNFASKSQGEKRRLQQSQQNENHPSRQNWKQKKKSYRIQDNPYYCSPQQIEREKREKQQKRANNEPHHQPPNKKLNNKTLDQYKQELRTSLMAKRLADDKKVNKKQN